MKSRSKQFRFPGSEFKSRDDFGGALSKTRRGRGARPVSTKESMHVILKSSHARGAWSFREKRNLARIDAVIRKNTAKFGVHLIRYSNNFNHLHLHVKFASRELYKRFVRAISGHIALIVTGASKLRPLTKLLRGKSFWDARPFSRIVRGRRGFKIANDYVRLNQLEAEGSVPKRDERLRGVQPSERRYFHEPKKRTKETRDQLEFGLSSPAASTAADARAFTPR